MPNFRYIYCTFIFCMLLSIVEGQIQPTERTQNIILPPAWAFGVLWGGYTNQHETIERIDSILRNDYPVDAYWIDSWFWDYTHKGKGPKGYLNFKPDSLAYPNVAQMFSFMKSNGIKSGVWIWDAIHKEGNEAVFEEFKAKNCFRYVYRNTDPWHNAGETVYRDKKFIKESWVGSIEFKNPIATALFQSKLMPLFQQGLDFLKLDRTSNLSFCKAAFNATAQLGEETKGRGFVISHSALYGNEGNDSLKKGLSYANFPAKWTDDTQIGWSLAHDSLEDVSWTIAGFKENVAQFTDPNKRYYNIPFLTCDAGGYKSDFEGYVKDDELYMRWTQFAFFTPIFECFTDVANPTSNLPWRYSEAAVRNFKKYVKLRMQLFPYIYSYAHQSRLTKNNIIRSDSTHLYQYLFGNELLIAPVVTNGEREKQIFLPEGEWIDFYNPKNSYKGKQTIQYQTSAEVLPILVRKGAIIPMRNYRHSIESGSNDTLTLCIYPDSRLSNFTLIEDDGASNGYLKGEIAFTNFSMVETDTKLIINLLATEGSYSGMKSKRTFILKINSSKKPIAVNVGKKLKYTTKNLFAENPLNNWFYDKNQQIIWVKITADKSKQTSLNIVK